MPHNLKQKLQAIECVDSLLQADTFNLGYTAQIPMGEAGIKRLQWIDNEDHYTIYMCTRDTSVAPIVATRGCVGLYIYSTICSARRCLSLCWRYDDSPPERMFYIADRLDHTLVGTSALCCLRREREGNENVLFLRLYSTKVKPLELKVQESEEISVNPKPWNSTCLVPLSTVSLGNDHIGTCRSGERFIDQ